MNTSTQQTKKHWDRLASDELKRDFNRKAWGGIGQVAQNHNFLTTGDPGLYWIDYMKEKYFEDGYAGHTLSLGCGEGFIERLFKERGFSFESITGIDLSEKCVEVAEKRAREVDLAQSIEYFSTDLNNYIPHPNKYNFIYFFHSLHHIKSLEKILEGCAKALLPGGIMMVNEFVGPSRFQWTEEQLNEANTIFRLLPEELRFDLSNQKIKERIKPLTIEEMIEIDESEAVRSAEIEVLLKEYFDILEEKNWGGTLTHLIFENTAGNYDPKNEYHNSIASLLVHHENILINKGILPSDFKFFMLRAKTAISD